jgi:CII-binding regulator of phage lambda lysogenization HflD
VDTCEQLATKRELDDLRSQVEALLTLKNELAAKQRIIDGLTERVRALEQEKLDSLTKNNFLSYFDSVRQQAFDIIGEAEI